MEATLLVGESPPYAYPIIYFQLFSYFLENKCLYDVIWDLKMVKKVEDYSYLFSYNLDLPNHMLVGGANVNSLCQQGRPLISFTWRHTLIGTSIWRAKLIFAPLTASYFYAYCIKY